MPSRRFADPNVKSVFNAYPRSLRADLLHLRSLIFEVAAEQARVGDIVETLKWGQPAYHPAKPRTGSTIRIDAVKADPNGYAMYFHCQTTLVHTYRQLYPSEFTFEGNRALRFSRGEPIPDEALKHCIGLCLTYHLKPARQ